MKPMILLAFAFILNAAAAQPGNHYMNNQKAIDSLLKATYSERAPGASIAIIDAGKVEFQKSYGLANTRTNTKLTASADFNIASLTKQFTALAILQLENRHRLSLNDKLSRFFPKMNKKVADVITVKQLLTHSSGIIDHYDYTIATNLKHAHNADVYKAIEHLDTTYFTPGSEFRYSNTAYCLLALIIEKLSGDRYGIYMTKNIFKPAGMFNTTVWSEKANIKNEVTGYEWDSTAARFKVSGPGEHIFFSTEGDGGIYTSVKDYIRWFTTLQSGKVFPMAMVEKARTIKFSINREKKMGYGFGWFIDESGKKRRVYHSGSNGGFRTFTFTVPATNSLVVIFSNRDDIDLELLVEKIVQLQWSNVKPITKIEALTS